MVESVKVIWSEKSRALSRVLLKPRNMSWFRDIDQVHVHFRGITFSGELDLEGVQVCHDGTLLSCWLPRLRNKRRQYKIIRGT